MSDACDRRNVGHLEGLRAGRFDHHGARVGLEQSAYPVPDQRIVERRLDAVAREKIVGEQPGRAVRIVADQEVVAGLQHAEQRRRDRCNAGWREADTRAIWSLQSDQGLLKRFGRRRAVAPVLVLAAVRMKIVGRGIQNGRTANHGRIDEALLRRTIATGYDQCRVGRKVQAVVGCAHWRSSLTGKNGVNPLTATASRSVMYDDLMSVGGSVETQSRQQRGAVDRILLPDATGPSGPPGGIAFAFSHKPRRTGSQCSQCA